MRVAEGGPAGVADVQRAGRVGGDELEVHGLPGEGVVVAVAVALLDDGLGEAAGRGGVEGDVDETGARDVHRGDAVDGADAAGELVGELARAGAERLRQFHGDVGRPVAVLSVLGPLQADVADGELCAAAARRALP